MAQTESVDREPLKVEKDVDSLATDRTFDAESQPDNPRQSGTGTEHSTNNTSNNKDTIEEDEIKTNKSTFIVPESTSLDALPLAVKLTFPFFISFVLLLVLPVFCIFLFLYLFATQTNKQANKKTKQYKITTTKTFRNQVWQQGLVKMQNFLRL